jgi:hypothetical protein
MADRAKCLQIVHRVFTARRKLNYVIALPKLSVSPAFAIESPNNTVENLIRFRANTPMPKRSVSVSQNTSNKRQISPAFGTDFLVSHFECLTYIKVLLPRWTFTATHASLEHCSEHHRRCFPLKGFWQNAHSPLRDGNATSKGNSSFDNTRLIQFPVTTFSI